MTAPHICDPDDGKWSCPNPRCYFHDSPGPAPRSAWWAWIARLLGR